mmetsp:Transcript_63268/g.119769  ORF Transcript_63268/g.119769 Transcript_63268/m.119769 type:complete len:215 (-) Transcript_63268:1509-2153(-)
MSCSFTDLAISGGSWASSFAFHFLLFSALVFCRRLAYILSSLASLVSLSQSIDFAEMRFLPGTSRRLNNRSAEELTLSLLQSLENSGNATLGFCFDFEELNFSRASWRVPNLSVASCLKLRRSSAASGSKSLNFTVAVSVFFPNSSQTNFGFPMKPAAAHPMKNSFFVSLPLPLGSSTAIHARTVLPYFRSNVSRSFRSSVCFSSLRGVPSYSG